MDTRRFFNPSLPQTLQAATMLCYLNGFFTLIALVDGNSWERILGSFRLGVLNVPLWLAAIGMLVWGGMNIAQTKRIGWTVATAGAVLIVVLRVFLLRSLLLEVNILGAMFDVALIVVLLHPQSQDHQRMWFD